MTSREQRLKERIRELEQLVRELKQRMKEVELSNALLRENNAKQRKTISLLISRLQKRHDTKDPICLN